MRVANERAKDVSEMISENTSDIAALFMRLRESSEGFPHLMKPVAYTPIGNGSGIRYNWTSKVFETQMTHEKPSTK